MFNDKETEPFDEYPQRGDRGTEGGEAACLSSPWLSRQNTRDWWLNRNFFSQFWKLEVQDAGAGRIGFC